MDLRRAPLRERANRLSRGSVRSSGDSWPDLAADALAALDFVAQNEAVALAAAPTPAIDRRWIDAADRALTNGSAFTGYSAPDPIAAHIALDNALRGEPFITTPTVPQLDPADTCTCGHRRDHHTNRDVDDVVGWPCLDCQSKRCRGFAALDAPMTAPDTTPLTPEEVRLAARFHDVSSGELGVCIHSPENEWQPDCEEWAHSYWLGVSVTATLDAERSAIAAAPTPAIDRERGDWMATFRGGRFYPLDPRPEDIDPRDIAHALSLLCRYGGHVERFYSVAEHCVLMSLWVPPEDALAALLHDATEAYVVDVPRPLKRSLAGYRAIETWVAVAIAARFGTSPDLPASVREADDRILLTERNALMPYATRDWYQDGRMDPLPVTIEGWPPEEAERRYADRLAELLAALDASPAPREENA
jgi:hypothetical protein